MPDERKVADEEDADIISTSVGEYGRWQLQLTFLLSLFNVPCTFHIFAPTFHAAERDVWCARPPNFSYVDSDTWKNLTQPHGFCTIYNLNSINFTTHEITDIPNMADLDLVNCTSWEFEGNWQTLISEFELLCDRKHLKNISEMLFLAGVALGGFVCGVFSDKYGRKKTLMASVALQTLLGTAIALTPWFAMYSILRAMLGFISVSVVFSGFVLSIELVGGVWRTVAGISYLFPVSISYTVIAGIAWMVRDWRQLQLAISLPCVLFLGLWWIIPESPRWLLAMGRTQEVKAILQHAASVNGRTLPSNLEKQLLPRDSGPVDEVHILDLFKTLKMRRITSLLSVIWFTEYLVYYGLVLNIGNIGGDLYVTSVLSGLVEVPAIAISIVILLKMGRKWPLALTLIFSGISCLLIIPIPYILQNDQWLITSLALIGKLMVSSANAIMPVFTAELYPTTMRNLGVGASNVSAGIALMLVPYLWEMSIPMSIVGACGVVGGMCVLFLPETGNAPLKDTLTEQAEAIENNRTR